MNMAVKLRQRQTRTGKDDAIHSSSGNWSASSESGRASIGSETTHQPKSTTTLSSAATSSNSLNHHHPSSSVCSRRKFLNTSTSSSVSEGTLTPDIVSDFVVPFVDDGETSSIYSCDTEGYYTSFHLDSGLKTLKEEETTSSPQTPLHSTSALSNSPGRGNNTLTAENEYELFGKGSTSTTTSSAGTVCTTLLVSNNESNLSLARGPTVPERKSSLDQKQNDVAGNSQMVVAMVHKQRGCEMSESPDSGHNTSSSPVDSNSSPHGTLTGRSSEYEFSESDLEGVDRLERIRVKTTINSSRIPSMCVITPPPSDDETSLSQYVPSSKHRGSVPSSNIKNQKSLLETDFGANTVCTQEKNLSPQITANEQRYQSSATIGNRTDCISPKQITSSDSVRNTVTSSALRPLRFSPKFGHSEVGKKDGQMEPNRSEQQKASLLPPLHGMLGKMKEVLQSNGSRKELGNTVTSTFDKINKDAGDYVTISKTARDKSPLHSPTASKEVKAEVSPSIDMEYVSLNELPVARSSTTANILISPSNSLERKRRQGARVTLDSEGKVIYSSDSLRRNKASHTTFEPGPYVKDNVASPTASPLMLHRVAKPNIRPVSLSNQAGNAVSYAVSKPLSPVSENRQFSTHTRTTSPISPKLGKVIIRAGNRITSRITSPVSPVSVVEPSHPMSPQSSRGAYIRMKSPDEHQQRSFSPGQSASAISEMQDEGKIPSYTPSTRLTTYLMQRNPSLYSQMCESEKNAKVKRSDSYRMANSPFLPIRKINNIEIATNTKSNPLTMYHEREMERNFKKNELVNEDGKALYRGNQMKDSQKENETCLVTSTSRLTSSGICKVEGLLSSFSHGQLSQNVGCAKKEDTQKVIINPNILGQKFYGTQVKVKPNLFDASTLNQSTVSKDSVGVGIFSNAGNDTEIW